MFNEKEELSYKKYEYFTNNNFAFVSIQHSIKGDSDGLETIDKNAIQAEARKHLWIRGGAKYKTCFGASKAKLSEYIVR